MTVESRRQRRQIDPEFRVVEYRRIRRYKTKRYRNDQEYRRHVLGKNADYRQRKLAACPEYAELLATSIRIRQVRDKIDGHLKALEIAEKELLAAIKKRDRLAEVCRAVRPIPKRADL